MLSQYKKNMNESKSKQMLDNKVMNRGNQKGFSNDDMSSLFAGNYTFNGDISDWDAFYLSLFWMLNTIGWVTFYWHWKHLTLWQGNPAQFNESSTYLMGWLRDYLWLLQIFGASPSFFLCPRSPFLWRGKALDVSSSQVARCAAKSRCTVSDSGAVKLWH